MRQACGIETHGLAYRPKFLQSYREAFLGCGGPQRRAVATASQSARLTQTTVQSVDSIAQLRLPCGGWYDTSLALFPATVPGPLRNRVISVEALPQPRRGKRQVALCHWSHWVSRL